MVAIFPVSLVPPAMNFSFIFSPKFPSVLAICFTKFEKYLMLAIHNQVGFYIYFFYEEKVSF